MAGAHHQTTAKQKHWQKPHYSRIFGLFFAPSPRPRTEYRDYEEKQGPVTAPTKPLPRTDTGTGSQALSTSFEKTCMRQIHCLDRLSAMVNKGLYHAQGLFSTSNSHRQSVCVCCSVCGLCEYRQRDISAKDRDRKTQRAVKNRKKVFAPRLELGTSRV